MAFQKLRKDLTEDPFEEKEKYEIQALTEEGIEAIDKSDLVAFLDENPLFKRINKKDCASLLKDYDTVAKAVKKLNPTNMAKMIDKNWLEVTSKFNAMIDGFNDFIDEYPDWEDYHNVDVDRRLKQSVSRDDWDEWTTEVVELIDIKDKSHSDHGANFDCKKTLAQVIDNVTDKVTANKKEECAKKIYKEYGYLNKF